MLHTSALNTVRKTAEFNSGNNVPMSAEHLLAQNNPVLRKQRGVWFTPQQAVDFTVRAVGGIQQQFFAGKGNVLTVIGNPPYNISSCNKSPWIEKKLADYKAGLSERNIQPLSDDYIKFIRFGQHIIEQQGIGILTYITNNGFLDGIIHRQMRRVLTQTFDRIYILNLHGNSRRNETAPDGSSDENIFDIQQGVSINFFIKSGQPEPEINNSSGTVFYADLYGTRQTKLSYLAQAAFSEIDWQPLLLHKPYYFFVPKDFSLQKEYDAGFAVSELFPVKSSGVKTHHDSELVAFEAFDEKNETYSYRVFDDRNICYNLERVERHRFAVMQHLLHRRNTALCLSRQQKSTDFRHVLAVNRLTDIGLFGDSTTVFPLYCYKNNKRYANFNRQIVRVIEDKTGSKIKPLELFDYIYAVLHSPPYRLRYQPFLKIDFPRIPYPESAAQYRQRVKQGCRLRKLHLFENVPKSAVRFPVSGNNIVRRVRFSDDRVWINESQYFADVPESAWRCGIGSSFPAEKFLKVRKNRKLSCAEIEHYCKIITVLTITAELTRS
ncbi:MAG: hypothetical protein LBT89_12205 [Planctomycetaceae bacterium]|nr:hypothetical protein [Planctomycetaceae bacterium]